MYYVCSKYVLVSLWIIAFRKKPIICVVSWVGKVIVQVSGIAYTIQTVAEKIVLCCLVSWIQLDNSSCQRDFLLPEKEVENILRHLQKQLCIYFNCSAMKIFAHMRKFLSFSCVSKHFYSWKIEVKKVALKTQIADFEF